MADTSDEHIARLHARLSDSREQLFELAQAMRGDEPQRQGETGETVDSGFPHSRLMRALMSKPAGMAVGTAALALSLLRPRLLFGAMRLTPMLKPMLMRYLLPRLLGQR